MLGVSGSKLVDVEEKSTEGSDLLHTRHFLMNIMLTVRGNLYGDKTQGIG